MSGVELKEVETPKTLDENFRDWIGREQRRRDLLAGIPDAETCEAAKGKGDA